jgi:trans-aconitate methyltransferase
VSLASDYAFPHSGADESRRLQLFEERLDPLTHRRLSRLGLGEGARCLEIGGGRGSVTRWLSDLVGPTGKVVATDLQVAFLESLHLENVEVLRHDILVDDFPPATFDLVHTRAVLMHVPVDLDLLSRMVSWLNPGGWLVLEEPDFGLRLSDHDPLWANHPQAWHKAFPNGSLSRGRSLLRQVQQLGLTDIGADAEVDIVQAGTAMAEFQRLSLEAIGPAAVRAGAKTPEESAALINRLTEPDFLACGFVHIGIWGRRPG